MIEIQVKSKEPIVMTEGLSFILSKMPMKVSMKMHKGGAICYKAFRGDTSDLVIAKEERDTYGNIVSLHFADVPAGVQCQWEDRETYQYNHDTSNL